MRFNFKCFPIGFHMIRVFDYFDYSLINAILLCDAVLCASVNSSEVIQATEFHMFINITL